MLLRIALDMFISEAYECKTIREIHDEIVRTTKLKTKYPWTRGMRAKIRPVVLAQEQKEREGQYLEAVRTLSCISAENLKTARLHNPQPTTYNRQEISRQTKDNS